MNHDCIVGKVSIQSHAMESERSISSIIEHPLFKSLRQQDRSFILECSRRCSLTFQQGRQLVEWAADLALWQEKLLEQLWDESKGSTLGGKARIKAIIGALQDYIDSIRQNPIDYSSFSEPELIQTKNITVIEDSSDIVLLGRCPCPVSGEKTRCCNLVTLDAVQQCAFGCSYCSIQAFYHQNEVRVFGDLGKRLDSIVLDDTVWHVGTGQSSDSLLLGDDYGTLSALIRLARRYPDTIFELKTKSRRTDWINIFDVPSNIVATWSLNAPTVIMKEEHLTATLEQRLDAAQAAAEAGIMIGFHIHPMVWFDDWKEEYKRLIDEICTRFSPHQVLMISFGTLTFTKPALRQLRKSGRPTKVSAIELTESAGKYSYPETIKRDLFGHAYSCFPDEWKTETGPFFYLCMELPSLWMPVFGRMYADNAAFESDMRRAYRSKLAAREGRVDKKTI